MSKSCSGILDEYITCVADSPCVKVGAAWAPELARAPAVLTVLCLTSTSGPRPVCEGLRQGRRRGAGVHAEAGGASRRNPEPVASWPVHTVFVGPTWVRKAPPDPPPGACCPSSSTSCASAARWTCGHVSEATRGTELGSGKCTWPPSPSLWRCHSACRTLLQLQRSSSRAGGTGEQALRVRGPACGRGQPPCRSP